MGIPCLSLYTTLSLRRRKTPMSIDATELESTWLQKFWAGLLHVGSDGWWMQRMRRCHHATCNVFITVQMVYDFSPFACSLECIRINHHFRFFLGSRCPEPVKMTEEKHEVLGVAKPSPAKNPFAKSLPMVNPFSKSASASWLHVNRNLLRNSHGWQKACMWHKKHLRLQIDHLSRRPCHLREDSACLHPRQGPAIHCSQK